MLLSNHLGQGGSKDESPFFVFIIRMKQTIDKC
jgi:hypothetical protein